MVRNWNFIFFVSICLIIGIIRIIHNYSLIVAMRKEWQYYSNEFKMRKSRLKKKKRRIIAVLISILILIALGFVIFMILKLDIKKNLELINLLYIIFGILICGGAFVIIKFLDDNDEMLEDHVSLINDEDAYYVTSKYGVKAYVSQMVTITPRRRFSIRNYYMIAKVNLESTSIDKISIREDIKKYGTLGDCKVNIYKENDYLIIECYMYSDNYISRNSKKAWYIEEKTIELFEKVLNQLDNY